MNTLSKLKKRGSIYLDVNTGAEFKKINGKFELQVDPLQKKLHNNAMRQIRYYEKKYNVSLKEARELESKKWKDYTKAVKDFNKGKISRLDTVQKRYNNSVKQTKETSKYYSKNNSNLKAHLSEKKKIFAMRTQGLHGIKNGKAFDDLINNISSKLNIDKDTTLDLLFPTKLEEASTYEEVVNVMNNAFNTIDDIINDKYNSGELDFYDTIYLNDLINGGIYD